MKIDSLELIGYDPEAKTIPSTVYSNLSPTPLPYRWEVGDDGQRFGGGWRPNPSADETVNVPYDISGHRVK